MSYELPLNELLGLSQEDIDISKLDIVEEKL